jgi:hypothetical protein
MGAPGDGAQGQVQCLDAAVRDQHLFRRQGQADAQGALGEQGAEAGVAVVRRGLDQQFRLLAQGADGGQAHRLGRVQLRRAAGNRQIGLGRMQPALGDEFRYPRMDADVLRRVRRLLQRRFLVGSRGAGRIGPARPAHKVAGARPRLDPARAFKLVAHFQGGGQADLMLPHQLTQGRQAVAGQQRAGLDGGQVVFSEAAVERWRVHAP